MEKSTVFKTLDPDALPVRCFRAWEYFLPGDEVEVQLGPEVSHAGRIEDVMPDGSGIWVYLNGVGRRLFGVEDDVQITNIRLPRTAMTVFGNGATGKDGESA